MGHWRGEIQKIVHTNFCFLSVIHRRYRPAGYETDFVAGQAELQIPPLRFAPVGMTILLVNERYRAK
jgi:hypothetical protein